jgi:methionyl-tRNA formyltransferase
MGTPDFAAAVLNKMVQAGLEVVGAVSQPDKPKGRGHKLAPTDVKLAAQAAQIPVYQPEKLKNGELKPILDELEPELIVVAAYGKILPSYILDYPKYGCINVHASLLPLYRGAAPIQRAIINGDKTTGVTIMQMAQGLDTGDMLMKAETEIGEYETAEQLFDRLAAIGGELLVEAVNSIDELVPEKQDDSKATYAAKIERADGEIDWTKSSAEISRLINGMNSWPLAYTSYKGEVLKIAEAIKCEADGKPGEIIELRKNEGLIVACGTGALCIKTAQFAGSRKMNVEDYARGHAIETGVILGKA